MADEIDYKIYGDDMQLVEVELDAGEAVRAEAGAMMYMEEGIEMQTSTGGGLFRGLKRMITGESFFITSFLNTARDKRHVAFGAPYPGKIIPLELAELSGPAVFGELCSGGPLAGQRNVPAARLAGGPYRPTGIGA
ncbi:hypothetical protein ES705_47542 [subsurface metagenome]